MVITAMIKSSSTNSEYVDCCEQFTDAWGDTVFKRVMYPQKDNRLMVKKERIDKNSTKVSIVVPDDYPLFIRVVSSYFGGNRIIFTPKRGEQ